MSYLVLFCSCVFSPLRLPRLGKRELILISAFRTFVRLMLVWLCRFPLPLGVWEGLRFVIVAPWTFLLPFFSSPEPKPQGELL